MVDISKADTSIYLFNAYSNLDIKKDFISGSDRVGIKLIENENNGIIVIAPSLFKKLLPSNVKFYSSDSLNFGNLFFRYLFRTIKTLHILRKIYLNRNKNTRYRIISTSDFFPDVIPSFMTSKKFDWYAFTYHLYPLNFLPRNFLGRFLQVFSFLMFRNSSRVVTTSSESENFLKKNFHLHKIVKIPLGIEFKESSKIEKGVNSLIYLGRIKESKGVFDLPEIMTNVVKEFPKVKLSIIGNGNDSDIERLSLDIKKKNLQRNIQIFQNLRDSEVKDLLSSAKILLQPSYEEGFGLSVLEALVLDTKVVLYNLPVYHEHFSEFDLDYVEIGNKIEFSLRIKNILKNNKETSYPKEYFRKFSWPQIFDKIFKDR